MEAREWVRERENNFSIRKRRHFIRWHMWVLDNIARRSKGGTFNFVEDGESMSEPFSQILGGLLSIVVQDLNLIVLPQPGDSTIDGVKSGAYPQTLGDNTFTVSFGDLFATEVRKIIVNILLPAVHRLKKVTVIIAYCTYRIKGKPFVTRKFRVTIHRTRSADPDAVIVSEAVRTEQVRECYIENLEEVRILLDNMDYHSAHAKLFQAKNDLQLQQSNSMIDILRTQLDELLELFRVRIGMPMPACLRSMTTSHRRQRIAETGPVKGVRLFGTQFTGMYREQAKHHEDRTKVLLPVPHDVERANIVRDQPGMKINRPPMVEAWDWESLQDSSWWACAMVVLCTLLAVGATVIGVVLFAMYLRRYRSRWP